MEFSPQASSTTESQYGQYGTHVVIDAYYEARIAAQFVHMIINDANGIVTGFTEYVNEAGHTEFSANLKAGSTLSPGTYTAQVSCSVHQPGQQMYDSGLVDLELVVV